MKIQAGEKGQIQLTEPREDPLVKDTAVEVDCLVVEASEEMIVLLLLNGDVHQKQLHRWWSRGMRVRCRLTAKNKSYSFLGGVQKIVGTQLSIHVKGEIEE